MRYWLWNWRGYAAAYSPQGKHFRKTPVPYTRCRRGGGYGFFRYPKTRQEIKANVYFVNDDDTKRYKIKVRRRRLKVPTAWDDFYRGDYGHNSWKRYRKHQWKSK